MSYGAMGRPDLALDYALKYSQMVPEDDDPLAGFLDDDEEL